jgi:hypothetical protein
MTAAQVVHPSKKPIPRTDLHLILLTHRICYCLNTLAEMGSLEVMYCTT